MFQSAPHFSSEANPVAVPSTPAGPLFQSAPHFSSEANLSPGSSGVKDRVVSIRASLQQRGEPIQRALLARWELFQSAPHFSSEANPLVANAPAADNVFQSAPHFSSEANACYSVIAVRRRSVSIRASLQQRGEQFNSRVI